MILKAIRETQVQPISEVKSRIPQTTILAFFYTGNLTILISSLKLKNGAFKILKNTHKRWK